MALTFLRNLGIVSAAGITTTKLGTGAVLQVIQATDTSNRSTTSATFSANSNTLSIAITPSSTSNKILIMMNGSVLTGTGNTSAFTIYRDSTNLSGDYGFANLDLSGIADPDSAIVNINQIYLDSPSTTSSITYTYQFRRISGSNTLYGLYGSSITGQMIAMEIKG